MFALNRRAQSNPLVKFLKSLPRRLAPQIVQILASAAKPRFAKQNIFRANADSINDLCRKLKTKRRAMAKNPVNFAALDRFAPKN